MEGYFAGVTVGRSWVLGEGAVQAIWARVRDPWTPFDHEAVLGYNDGVAQTSGRAFSQVQTARDEIQRLPVKGRWAAMPVAKVGAELDQLAVDPNGRLVLIELKDAGAGAASVYYSPLQLLQYVHEWAAAFDGVRDSLCALIEARKELGLSPSDATSLTAPGRLRRGRSKVQRRSNLAENGTVASQDGRQHRDPLFGEGERQGLPARRPRSQVVIIEIRRNQSPWPPMSRYERSRCRRRRRRARPGQN